MNDAQKKAWDCLNEIERQSLFLLFFDLTAPANEAFVILLKDVLKRD